MPVKDGHTHTLTPSPPRATYHFGPGSLENIEVTTWTRNGHGYFRVIGTWTVYCGFGNSHEVPICVKELVGDMFIETVEDAARSAIDWELGHWSDPCADGL